MPTKSDVSRVSGYECAICGTTFTGRGAKDSAIRCTMLPTKPFAFQLGVQVVYKLAKKRMKNAVGKVAKGKALSRYTMYRIIKRKRIRRGGGELNRKPAIRPAHVNMYELEKEGQSNSIHKEAYERQLVLAG